MEKCHRPWFTSGESESGVQCLFIFQVTTHYRRIEEVSSALMKTIWWLSAPVSITNLIIILSFYYLFYFLIFYFILFNLDIQSCPFSFSFFFLPFIFFSISSINILFHLIYVSNSVFILLITIFLFFSLLLIYFIFQFSPSLFSFI